MVFYNKIYIKSKEWSDKQWTCVNKGRLQRWINLNFIIRKVELVFFREITTLDHIGLDKHTVIFGTVEIAFSVDLFWSFKLEFFIENKALPQEACEKLRISVFEHKPYWRTLIIFKINLLDILRVFVDKKLKKKIETKIALLSQCQKSKKIMSFYE